MASSTRIRLRHERIRKQVVGTTERPRLCWNFAGQHIYTQVIDDTVGKTVAAASTVEKGVRGSQRSQANVTTAEKVGSLLAERTLQKNVRQVVFDRGGFTYHGRVKALADAARSAGLEF